MRVIVSISINNPRNQSPLAVACEVEPEQEQLERQAPTCRRSLVYLKRQTISRRGDLQVLIKNAGNRVKDLRRICVESTENAARILRDNEDVGGNYQTSSQRSRNIFKIRWTRT